jgi:excisionase family DNA binding protein
MQFRRKRKRTQRKRMGYSVPEVAHGLGMAQSGLWKWIARGKIRSVKIGNRRIITDLEVQRLLNEGLK